MWELYDAVPETVAEKLLYTIGVIAVSVVFLVTCAVASGIF